MTEHIETTSRDTLSDQLGRLSDIFPQFVKEGKIDFDAFRTFFDEAGLSAGDEKYGLSWAGKSDAFRAIRVPSTGTFAPHKDESRNWDTTGNVFIEGDNLEVLKLLQKHYYGAVKMIYIDPPYNTGKDFVYKDNSTESVADYYERTGQSEGGIRLSANTEKNGRYHSDWLTMMYPRLFLAKNLLREDGVIFVSIDDNEVANLRLVMDEIFGEENFVAQIVWQKKYAASNDAKGIPAMHDYIIVYQRSENFERALLPRTDKQDSAYKFDDNDGKGLWRSDNLLVKTFSESGVFPIVNPNTGEEFYPKKGNSWRGSRETIDRWLEEGRIFFGKDGKGAPQLKRYLSEVQQGVIPVTWWTYEDGGHNDQANKELQEIFGESRVPFDTPKPSKLIRKMLQIGSSADESHIILDFFAGSGTTAHAVMAQNAEDRGNRKWICVQIPEETDEASEAFKAGYKTISAISRERIRRAGEKIACSVIASAAKQSSGSDTEAVDRHDSSETRNLAKTNVDTGFKAYTLSPSNYRKWRDITGEDDEAMLRKQIDLFAKRPLVDGFDEEELVYEILVKEGFDLNASVAGPAPLSEGSSPALRGEGREQIPVWTISDGDRKLIVTLAEKVTREAFDALGLSAPDTFVCLDSALDDSTKLNLARSVNLKTI